MERPEIAEKLLEYLDIPADIKDDTEAKAFFDERFGKIDLIKENLKKDKEFLATATGKVTGSILTALKRVSKDLGIELPEDEIKGKQTEEILEMVSGKVKSTTAQKLKELQDKVTDPGAALGEWEKEKAKLIGEKAYIEDLYQKQGQEFEGYKTTQAEKERTFKLTTFKDNLYKSIPFPKEADPLKIEGFKSLVEKSVSFELEDDKFVVKKDGNPIPNPAKASTFYTPEDYLKEEAVKNGLFTLNSSAGQRVVSPTFTTEPEKVNTNARPVNGLAMANEL